MFCPPFTTHLCDPGGWPWRTTSRAFRLVFSWVQLKGVTSEDGREEEKEGQVLIFLLPGRWWAGAVSPIKDHGTLSGIFLYSQATVITTTHSLQSSTPLAPEGAPRGGKISILVLPHSQVHGVFSLNSP